MGAFLLIMAALLWGIIGSLSKYIFAQGVTPLETAFWRGTIAGVAYLIHGILGRYQWPQSKRDWAAIILFGILGVALLEGSFVFAVSYGGAALASVLLYSAPIWVNLAGYFFFKESISIKRWFALGLTFSGVVGVCLWGSQVAFTAPGLCWGLASGLSYACFYIAGKTLFHKINPVVVYMFAFPIGSCALLIVIGLTQRESMMSTFMKVTHYSSPVIGSFAVLGLISTYLAYLLYSQGLKYMEASRASIITMVEPIISVSLAAWMWGEVFSIPGYIFAAMVALGVALC
jgi:drug/metabolite transporter, DME family